MRARTWISFAGFIAVAMIAPSPVLADVDWAGAGYYIEDDMNEYLGGFIAGPYLSQTDCENALAAMSKDHTSGPACHYYATNPDDGQY